MTAIPLGGALPPPLDATYPQPRRAGSSAAYSVLLRVEIARFTRSWLEITLARDVLPGFDSSLLL